jgi:DnaK suppressor protein
MFVSLLQLFGFASAKPVHSRADEKPPAQAPVVHGVVSTGQQIAQVKPVRRQEVKPQPGQIEAATPKSKSAGKAATTVTAPVSPKAPPKAPAAVKVPVKATKAAQVEKSKPPAAVPTPAKAVKPTAKEKTKDSVKTTTDKASKAEETPVKVKAPRVLAAGTLSKAAASTPAKPVTPVPVPAPVPTPPSATGVPVRAGRPSSRLAQLTVPSMAQSVASTAAKASYAQIVSEPPIVPPLASAVKKDPKLANNWKSKSVDQLNDAELMAMPDDEYMNDTQMAYFRLKLSRLKTDILSNAGETTEHLREDTVVVPDPADRATIEEEHALELRTRDRERKLLKKIEQSIVRIDAGDYGYCDETGEAIGVGRLLARPTANLSLEAQQRRELKQKMFGD